MNTTEPEGASPERRSTRRRWMIAAAAVVAGAALVAGGWLAAQPRHTAAATASAPVDMRGNPVQPEETVHDAKAVDAVASTGERFTVPSVGLDVPLGALNVVDGRVVPPGFTSAYEIRNLGVAPADAGTGTVYVVMHSLRDGAVGPGNYLIDVAAARSSLAQGAQIDVAGRTYRVTSTRTVLKDDLPTAPGIWDSVPGRLVVITCLQRPQGGASVQNVVITAQLASGAQR